MSPRFVEVPADRLLGRLREIGAKVERVGGLYSEHVVGREVVVDVAPPRAPSRVRVYTSLAAGASEARDCGDDAVRIVLLGFGPDGTGERPLCESEKVLRTAPRGAADRVAVFLERLTDRVRAKYADARLVRTCACGRAMAVRENRKTGSRFLGCSGYPECRNTAPIERESGASHGA